MSTADLFGSDSSGNEFDPAEAAAVEAEEEDVQNEGEHAGRAGSSGGGNADVLEDSDDDNNNTAAAGGESAGAFEPATGGTGLSDSEDEEPPPQQQQPSAADAVKRADADVFGTDSEDDIGAPSGGGGAEAGGGASAAAEDGFDPFEDSDDDGGKGGGSGSQEGKTLRAGGGGRLSKGGGGGKEKGKKRKAGADGSSSKKKSKSKSQGEGGDASSKKKKKRKRKGGEDGGEGEGEGGGKKKKGKKKKGKKKKGKASVESSTLQDLGLESSADEAAGEEDDDDLSDEEVEHEDEDEVASGDEAVVAGDARRDVRTRDDDDFIDNSDDNADLLEEYKRDAPEGDHSEAEEDNGPEDDTPKKESAMASVLASMKKRKAQELGTAEREQIAQEFMFKINQAAEDDEEAVQNESPAIYKLKMLPTLKATLAKKELQETFLEFDLLGVLKRWLQPYSNKQLPNLTVRRAVLEQIRGLPVQIDHLKRSGIGKTVMGLLNCKEETTENKRILRELVSKWNRPVYEKETNYRARRPAHDDEAMEVRPKGASPARRRVVSGITSQRDGASRDEAVGNILNARAKGLDPTKARVPFSNGYAFSKAPRSRVEGNGRAPSQQVDTSARAKILKKIAGLAKPVSKSA